jgi:hypothetical protein
VSLLQSPAVAPAETVALMLCMLVNLPACQQSEEDYA